MLNRKPYDFDPDKLKKGKEYIVTKTFHVDWSGWLEKLFLKIFRKKGGK